MPELSTADRLRRAADASAERYAAGYEMGADQGDYGADAARFLKASSEASELERLLRQAADELDEVTALELELLGPGLTADEIEAKYAHHRQPGPASDNATSTGITTEAGQ